MVQEERGRDCFDLRSGHLAAPPAAEEPHEHEPAAPYWPDQTGEPDEAMRESRPVGEEAPPACPRRELVA